jgi:hypothetical protein
MVLPLQKWADSALFPKRNEGRLRLGKCLVAKHLLPVTRSDLRRAPRVAGLLDRAPDDLALAS